MLTQDDLKAIGTLVGEQIREEVPKIIKDLVPPMLDELEVRMNTKFDAMHEHMEGMESRLVTKSYLDDKLAHYVKKTF